jgi:hypothetical protein
MSESNLGAGLYLDSKFDLNVAQTGDLRSSSGSEELEKDLAFQLKIVLDDIVGQPLTPDVRAEIISLTIDTITSDLRVQTLDRSSITVTRVRSDALFVEALVETKSGEQELVLSI